jgi:hypothetical protein
VVRASERPFMTSTGPVTSRRLRGLAAAACAAVLLPAAAATPALAQTSTTTTERAAATSASALRLTVSLPQGNSIQLDIDPVSGTVRSVTGSGPEAEALATLISGSIAGNAQSFPGAEARLPEPREGSGPTNALGDGINSSPLGAFLTVGLLTASASVTEAPGSTSAATIADLGVGLPAQLGEGLAQVFEQLFTGLDQALQAVAPLDEATVALCEGIEPVTTPVQDGVRGLPVLGPALGEAVAGTLTPQQGVVCNLRAFLVELAGELDESLADLSGPGGLVSTGLIGAEQSIATEGGRTTALASASVAELAVAGQNPFGTVDALRTTSTAVIDGGTSTATVETTAVEAVARPLLTLNTDLETVTGELTNVQLAPLTEVLAQVTTLLDALAGIGLQAGPLDREGALLEGCPETLDGQLSGTFEQDGVCAAAAARGLGLTVTLPEQLATPLGVTGPLVALQIVPSAAVVRAASTTTTTPAPPTTAQGELPRTGAEAPLAAVGLALLLGAAAVRRRRSTVDA